MLVQFKNAYLERIFQGKAVAGKPRFSIEIVEKFKKTVLKLQYADNIGDLRKQRGLNFEALKGNYKGYYSVRVDYSYRLILTLDKNDHLNIADIISVHDLTNHYQ